MESSMEKRTIGVVGFGVIGQRWAAAFAHAQCDVRVWDPDGAKKAAFTEILPGLIADLDALKGKESALGEIQFFTTLSEALSGVNFVQENGPETIDLKRKLLADIEQHVGDDVIIASSSS